MRHWGPQSRAPLVVRGSVGRQWELYHLLNQQPAATRGRFSQFVSRAEPRSIVKPCLVIKVIMYLLCRLSYLSDV